MKYYHVFIQSLEKRGLWRQGISFDHSKENMMECIVSPFNKRKTFRFGERLVDLKKIDRILVFESDKQISEIVLPNGEDPHEADMSFLIHSFWKGKVEGVRECTSEFVIPSEKKVLENKPANSQD